MGDLLPDGVEVPPPRGQEAVEAVPVLLGEGPVHGRGDVDQLVGLVQLGADQLRLQHWKREKKEKIKTKNKAY